MNGNARHYFPGNNTPVGFFSYYHYILDQREAKQIWCIKGGPGTGKSSFMKKIGETMLAEGHDVDFLHCSSDSGSLDGILLRDLNVSLIDATAPHVIDPVNPGAVDNIINLGDYWNEKGIRENRKQIIETNERIGAIFARVYNYLRAAESMYDNIAQINGKGLSRSVIYEIGSDIIKDEMGSRTDNQQTGKIKKFFASAITPDGLISYLPDLIDGYKKVYVLKSETGGGTEAITAMIMEAAVSRGFDVEAFYCPLKPGKKLEHLLIPQLSLAVATSNPYHEAGPGRNLQERVEIGLRGKGSAKDTLLQNEIAIDSGGHMEELLSKAVHYLSEAKAEHDRLEAFYIPHMDFKAIEELRLDIEKQLRQVREG
jgi:hypothetical protein